jgi:transcriptional regulator with XRE-family HTH domain
MDGATDVSLGDYIWSRVSKFKSAHGLTHTRLAEIMGFERSAMLRAMKSKRPPRIESLWKLSCHFGVPMAYWSPVFGDDEIKLVVTAAPEPPSEDKELQAVKLLLRQFTPLTKKMLNELNRLPAPQKRVITVLALRYPHLIADAFKVAEILGNLDEQKRNRVVKAMKTVN